VLGPDQAQAFRAVGSGLAGVLGVVRVGAHAQGAVLVRPAEQAREVGVLQVGNDGLERALVQLADRAVDADLVAFLELVASDGHRPVLEIDLEIGDADDGGLAELAGDQRRVAGAAAAAGEDAVRGEHAVHVVRLRLRADHDHGAAALGPALGGVGIERDAADGGSGRDVQTGGQLDRRLARGGRELRVEEHVDLLGRDAADRFAAPDQALLGHVDRDADLGLRGALAVARLEQPELAVLDGELHVLHVAVVLLEPGGDLLELLVHRRHLGLHLADRLGGAGAGDDVLALRVVQVVAFEDGLAGGGVAAHRDAGGAILAHVAEHHRLDVHRGAEVVTDAAGVAVVTGALAVPRLEHRLGREAQLLVRILGEVAAGVGADDLLELAGDLAPVVGGQLAVDGDAGHLAAGGDHGLEHLVRYREDHAAEHLDQAAVAVPHEAGIGGQSGEPLGDLVAEADVEDRVHHAGHAELRAGAAGDQQRTARVAEALAGGLLDRPEGLHLLIPDAVRERLAGLEVGVARLGGDGEAGRDRHAQARHVAQVRALAAEKRTGGLPAALLLLGFVDIAE